MTVQELIDKLQEFPEQSEVMMEGYTPRGGIEVNDINSITYGDDKIVYLEV